MNIEDVKYYIKENVEYYKNKYNRRCIIINLVYNDGYRYPINCLNISCYNCDSFNRRYLR